MKKRMVLFILLGLVMLSCSRPQQYDSREDLLQTQKDLLEVTQLVNRLADIVDDNTDVLILLQKKSFAEEKK